MCGSTDGFATPEIFDVLDAEPGLDYVVAMANTGTRSAWCVARVQPAMASRFAALDPIAQAAQTVAMSTLDVQYAAGTWAQARRDGHQSRRSVQLVRPRAAGQTRAIVVIHLRQTPRFIYEEPESNGVAERWTSRIGSKSKRSTAESSRSVETSLLSLRGRLQLARLLHQTAADVLMREAPAIARRGPPVLAPRCT